MPAPPPAYPFQPGPDGRIAAAGPDRHVRDMIYQVLFTAPGERVNRPDFGCGLQTLLFEPNADLLAAATEFLVNGALQRWLGDVIRVERVTVEAAEEQLRVEVVYTRRDTGATEEAEFTRPASGR